MKLRFSIWLLLLASLNACSKYEHSYRSVDPAVKAHIDWRPGSYWIMQDSASGALDSFYVASYKTGTFHGSDDRDNETISIVVKESGLPFANDTMKWYVHVGDLGNTYNLIVDASLFFDKSFNMYGLGIYFYPLSTFKIDNISYQKARVGIFSDGPPTYNSLTLAMHDTNGFIYICVKSIVFNHTWFLIRNKIVHGS